MTGGSDPAFWAGRCEDGLNQYLIEGPVVLNVPYQPSSGLQHLRCNVIPSAWDGKARCAFSPDNDISLVL